MAPPLKLTWDHHGELVNAMLSNGDSYRRIGLELGCDKNTVRDFARRNGIDATQDNPLQLLVIDIETRPALAYVWGAWKQNIAPSQVVEDKAMISFAARWVGKPDSMVFFSDHHDGHDVMVRAAHVLLDQADAVIHYNGERFDVPHMNTEFWKLGLFPPQPFKQIDLLATIRRKFMFLSRKLDSVADHMLDEHKIEHEGFALWTKCLAGDADAWDRMRSYNIHDVEITERLYHKALPWIENHPSVAAMSTEFQCISCGSRDLERKGLYYTKTRAYPQYQCGSCGKWQRDTHSSQAGLITGVAG